MTPNLSQRAEEICKLGDPFTFKARIIAALRQTREEALKELEERIAKLEKVRKAAEAMDRFMLSDKSSMYRADFLPWAPQPYWERLEEALAALASGSEEGK